MTKACVSEDDSSEDDSDVVKLDDTAEQSLSWYQKSENSPWSSRWRSQLVVEVIIVSGIQHFLI